MSACKKWQAILSDAVHGDGNNAEEQSAFQAHLSQCSGCRQELAAQTAFISTMVLPAPPAAGQLNAWRTVGPAVYTPPPARFVLGLPLAAAMAFAMLLTGIGIGRLLDSSGPATAVPGLAPGLASVQADTDSDEVAGEDEYLRFLENAAPLLLAITNRRSGTLVSARYPGQPQSSSEKVAAAELAADAESLARRLSEQQKSQEAALVRELELVFLQIANLSHPTDDAGLKLLQAAISDRALLFQLTVEELRHLPQSRPGGA